MAGIEPQQLLIAKLAQASPQGHIGRTALMKLCYFLQTVRGVPLPYRFTLYSYGPFDKDVLYDLGVAGNLGLVNETVVVYSGGYGYEIRSLVDDEALHLLDDSFLREHAEEIAWVTTEFGGRSAAELELAATIVYADRENAEDSRTETIASLSAIVQGVKPHFSREAVAQEVESLRGKGLLRAIA